MRLAACTSHLPAPGHNTEFSCSADDACSIELDGQIMIGSSVCGFCASCTKTSATQSIIGGVYSVRLHFCEVGSGGGCLRPGGALFT